MIAAGTLVKLASATAATLVDRRANKAVTKVCVQRHGSCRSMRELSCGRIVLFGTSPTQAE
jgi:hypothetical protein